MEREENKDWNVLEMQKMFLLYNESFIQHACAVLADADGLNKDDMTEGLSNYLPPFPKHLQWAHQMNIPYP